MSRSVAVLSYYDVSELRNGRSLRVNGLLDAAGSDALLFQPHRKHPRYDTVPYAWDLGRRKVGINWGIFNFYMPPNRRLISHHCRKEKPRVVVLSSMWDLPPVASLGDTPLLLDAHNVDAVYMEQRYGARHWFARLVERTERRVLDRVAHVFCCSEGDRDIFEARYGVSRERMSVVPNGVDCARFAGAIPPAVFDPSMEERLKGKTVLFFMGKLDYPPNAQALEFMGKTLLPELARRAPGRFVLLVTGSPVPAISPHPDMIFAGLVPELPPALMRADICLAPLFVGSGTRLKILDYLAAGKPVVATPVAIEGIHAQPGLEAIIDSAETFADHVMRLADHPEQAKKMALAGQAFVQANFDWSQIVPKWKAVLDRYS